MKNGPLALASVHIDIELSLAAVGLAVATLYANDVTNLVEAWQMRLLAGEEGDEGERVDYKLWRISRHEFARLILNLHRGPLVERVVDDFHV